MSKETAFFAFRRGNENYSCRGEDLKFTATQDDFFFFWRNGVVYKTRLAINPDRIESVGTELVNLNYEQYAFVRDRNTGQTLAETSPPFADVQQELRVYEHLFDGDENTKFKSYTNNGIQHDVVVEFPEPIDVYGDIEIKAGFHTNQRVGQLLINNRVVLELSAWDGDPQVFNVPFTGQVREFSIRQKNNNGLQCTAAINYIQLDGAKLQSEVNTTKLVMAVGTDMSQYKVNMKIKQYDGTVVAKIGAVDEPNRILYLTEIAAFRAGDGILIEQIVDDMLELDDIQNTDLFACTEQHSPTNHISYKVTGDRFVELFRDLTPNFEVLSGNVYLNLKFSNTSATVKVVKAENGREYECRGSYNNLNLPVGNYFVPTLEGGGLQCIKLYGTANNGNFDFKSNFDMSTVENMRDFVRCCGLFNGDISHFNLQNVSCAYQAFDNCRNFNASVGGGFNMANATNVDKMFADCHKFNKPINEFKFPKATNIRNTWYNCSQLNQDISSIEWKDNALLYYTWYNCRAMNHPKMAEAFPFPACIRLFRATDAWRGFNQSVANWTQPISYEMAGLFRGWPQFNQDVGHFNTSNVTCMAHVFDSTQTFNHPSVRNWDTSRCHNFAYAFHSTQGFDVELDTWDMSSAINLYAMFQGARNIGKSNSGYYNLESWDTSNVTDMGGYMFWKTSLVKGISTWNTSKVRDMKGIFSNSIVSDDLSGWDVSNVVQMSNLCCQWGQREADKVALTGNNVFCMNFEDWNTKSVEWFQYAFYNAKLSQPLYLHGWRMPNLPYLWTNPNNSSDIRFAAERAYGSDNNENNTKDKWNPMIMSGHSRDMPVIEAGVYEPDLTLLSAVKQVDWNKYENSGPNFTIGNAGCIKVRYNDGTYLDRDQSNSRTLEVNGVASGYYTIDIFFNQNLQTRIGPVNTTSSNVGHSGWQIAPRRGANKHLMNKPKRSFTISGHATNLFGLDQSNQSTMGLKHLDTSLLTNTHNMFIDFPYAGGLIYGNPKKVYLDIETWDMSNVTCMANMFMGFEKNSYQQPVLVPAKPDYVEMGDLRGWCVQHVTSEPPSWNNELPEVSPCWGQCPAVGELGDCEVEQPPINKPMPPLGAWRTQDQQYYITIDENAGRYDQYFINFGTLCQLWRADRGSQNWSKRSNASYIYLDKTYDWIVTSRYSGEGITFQSYNGPFEFLGADTANVTNMSNMFKESEYFNDDIGWWDTSNVQNMRNMFGYAASFNQDLSGWDVSNVSCSRDFDYRAYNWDQSYKPNFN